MEDLNMSNLSPNPEVRPSIGSDSEFVDALRGVSGTRLAVAIPAAKALDSLVALKERREHSAERLVIDVLETEGMISCMSSAEARALNEAAAGLKGNRTRLESSNRAVIELQSDLGSLQQRHDSTFQQIVRLQWLFPESREREARKIAELGEELELYRGKQAEAKAAYDQSSRAANKIDGFCPCGKGNPYSALTEKGATEVARLAARRSLLKETDYRQLSRGAEAVMQAVRGRIERVDSVARAIEKLGFSRSEIEESRAGLALASQEGDVKSICAGFKTVCERMELAGWRSRERLAVAARISARGGDPKKEFKNVEAAFAYLRDKQRYPGSSYRTWHVACSLLEVPGVDIESKYARFQEAAALLVPLGRRKGVGDSTFVALELAKMKGDLEDLAERFHSLEKKLTESTRVRSPEPGLAALRLLGSPGTETEKTARVTDVLNFLSDYRLPDGGSRKNYTAAAALSGLPGSMEANVQSIAEVCDSLKSSRYRNISVETCIPVFVLGMKDALRAAESRGKESGDLAGICAAYGLSSSDSFPGRGVDGSAPMYTESATSSKAGRYSDRWRAESPLVSDTGGYVSSSDDSSFFIPFFMSSDMGAGDSHSGWDGGHSGVSDGGSFSHGGDSGVSDGGSFSDGGGSGVSDGGGSDGGGCGGGGCGGGGCGGGGCGG